MMHLILSVLAVFVIYALEFVWRKLGCGEHEAKLTVLTAAVAYVMAYVWVN